MRPLRTLVSLPAAAVLVGGLLVTAPPGASATDGAEAVAAAEETSFPTYGSGLRVREDATTQSVVVSTLADAETISVDCQKQGETIEIPGGSSSWWAHVPAKGGYVSVAYVDIPEAQLPGVPECGTEEPDPEPDPDPAGEVSYDDLIAMFPGKVGDQGIVEEGLPSLNAAMEEAEITTAPRQAAFLATLANESLFEYNIVQSGGATYTGRGYIQLTGDFNYEAAGNDLGIDLLGNPELAASLDHSAQIAKWYWTVARDINPLADALDMGAVDAAIGYAPDPNEDVERCDDFKAALQFLTGEIPEGINCVRPTVAGGKANTRRQGPQQFSQEMNQLLRRAGAH